ncbi:hypothetical protein [Desulfovibrio ferrophilus]|uniref:Uncharacterized protein n=1 Tax=Desulfovibrio ferrophilus TaxID=241368 RepID=A0A2Z6B0P3_9BACT|nr:hypothetical protein [Desulfovibrio ferrophilus]BBD09033.1 uncharacterized protein DFE_2307 [Desulfovibrio ferrophilus]
MNCVMINNWKKSEKAPEAAQQAAEMTRKHWQEIALDHGYAPNNVCLAERDGVVMVGLSEEMYEDFREGTGGWSFY